MKVVAYGERSLGQLEIRPPLRRRLDDGGASARGGVGQLALLQKACFRVAAFGAGDVGDDAEDTGMPSGPRTGRLSSRVGKRLGRRRNWLDDLVWLGDQVWLRFSAKTSF